MSECSTIEELYKQKCETASDISPLMPILRAYADECEMVVEFGMRHGFSTTAFLASKAMKVISFDISIPKVTLPPETAAKWAFCHEDTAKLETGGIPICDMLFIDTLHTTKQVDEELRQAPYVRKYLAFHDTYTFGCVDERTYTPEGKPIEPEGHGIIDSISRFMRNNHDWVVDFFTVESNGLLILKRVNQNQHRDQIVATLRQLASNIDKGKL